MTFEPSRRIRRFNRAVTSALGLLDDAFLGRGRPLGVARVLNGIGRGHARVADLRAFLAIDSAALARHLRALEAEGLLSIAPDPVDARARIAFLTEAGEAEFAAYERLADDHARTLLDGRRDADAILAAMDLVATALGPAPRIETVAPDDPDAIRCLDAYYADLATRLGTGYDPALAGRVEVAALSPPMGAFLLARTDDLPVGCVAVKGTGGTTGEIKRLWVSPSARGQGLARRLMEGAEDAARALGLATLRLDSNSALTEAAALYRASGWHEIARYNDDPYPDLFFEKSL
ncbi:helix-turn-helix domain-containing GNAT family N-acetyltransferase [Palleronia sp. LCG004]|uniref:bifunctional helix-turn-helix transcriptional regulator/GNAT family N-acetyltransferase n=1 Tax=Palleronia sp. LCG004 TaxID=3079304 RepID=UPI002941FE07|nr:helix-turn-helix domain-containing GNAT family N-acetyltransferase [Palleronia sp. LCG004]WOI57844.1 helix-turn-helix domain-containing GNAT family N-acetyltransferase [Palleronia sp. LCG004]